MSPSSGAKTPAECKQACCAAGKACNTWLFNNDTGCFVSGDACTPMTPGGYYVGATAIPLPGPAATPTQRNVTVSSTALPAGCSIALDGVTNTAVVTFNTNNGSTAACGTSSTTTTTDASARGGGGGGGLKQNGQATHASGAASSLIQFAVALDATVPGGNATITLQGPADVWFGVGLGAASMADTPNAIIVAGDGSVTEHKLADQAAGQPIATSVVVLSNHVTNGERTVVMARPFKGQTPDHFDFDIAVRHRHHLPACRRRTAVTRQAIQYTTARIFLV